MDSSNNNEVALAEVHKAKAKKPIVFLIDDEEDLLLLISSRLKRSNLEVRGFLTAAEFRLAFTEFLKVTSEVHSRNEVHHAFDLAFIVTDFRLTDSTGLEILVEFANEKRIAGAALQTGFYLEDVNYPKLRFPFRVFEKPVEFDDLVEFIEECTAHAARSAETA